MRTVPIVLALTLATIAFTGANAAAPVNGRWVTEEKNAIVEIAPCGVSLCGKIARFLVSPPQGVGQKDTKNPDKTLRTRTLLGANILSGFKAAGSEWHGQIYDPKSGKTYRSVVYKGVSGNLVVKGCIGPFCKTQTWTPAGR
jgi:uncharacterized protein (DUF2147 family)